MTVAGSNRGEQSKTCVLTRGIQGLGEIYDHVLPLRNETQRMHGSPVCTITAPQN